VNDGHGITPQAGTDLVRTLEQRVSLATTLSNPDITLARASATYILYKRKRLTPATERGYRAALDDFTAAHPNARLAEFDPPVGSHLIEDYLGARYGHLEPRTYNKAHSVLSDLFKWHVARGTIARDPMLTIERAKTRQVLRQTFTDAQVIQILAANTAARDQIALRLLLFFGIRKGALRGIRFEHFNAEKQSLVVFTKGQTIHTLQIVDETVWALIDGLREPDHHYLMPKRVTRKRIPPTKKALHSLAAALVTANAELLAAAEDQACRSELAAMRESLEIAAARLKIARDAASTQVRIEPTEAIGEHGLHLWWYRCLTKAGIVASGTTAGRKMHGARHTAIQRVLDKTGNLKAAQALAGHAHISTTGDTYTDWSPEQQAETMREVLA
jgi:integrase